VTSRRRPFRAAALATPSPGGGGGKEYPERRCRVTDRPSPLRATIWRPRVKRPSDRCPQRRHPCAGPAGVPVGSAAHRRAGAQPRGRGGRRAAPAQAGSNGMRASRPGEPHGLGRSWRKNARHAAPCFRGDVRREHALPHPPRVVHRHYQYSFPGPWQTSPPGPRDIVLRDGGAGDRLPAGIRYRKWWNALGWDGVGWNRVNGPIRGSCAGQRSARAQLPIASTGSRAFSRTTRA